MYHHMTTSTTIVRTTLDSRGQPVATERAIPSADSHLPLVTGNNQLPQYCYYYRVCTYRVQASINIYIHYSLMKEHPWALYVHIKYRQVPPYHNIAIM